MRYGNYVSFPSFKRYTGTFINIIGEIKNTSSQYIKLSASNKIEATFYDTNGSIIDFDIDLLTVYRYTDTEIISPGGK